MEFEWDPVKAAANLQKHGISFDAGVLVFSDKDRVDFDVSRENDMEKRRKSVGLVNGRLFVVIYTLRGTVLRIISARRTNRSEEIRYGNRPLSP